MRAVPRNRRTAPLAPPTDLKPAATRDITVKAIRAEVFACDGHRDIFAASLIEVWMETRRGAGPGSCPRRAARQMRPRIGKPRRWRKDRTRRPSVIGSDD